MRVDGSWQRSLRWRGERLEVLDQQRLPFETRFVEVADLEAAARAIESMLVRGAPLIGVVAACGVALALRDDPSDAGLAAAARRLLATRPTAVNLRWALGRMQAALAPIAPAERAARALREAARIEEEEVAVCVAIGEHGAKLLEEIAAARGAARPLQVLTHCNAGWLATVDWGTALAPVYRAHEAGLALHVWVDETRPRRQGASLTAWELAQHGVPHSVIADNASGHFLQRGEVDLCLVGTDRTTADGDVCNKIGTYLTALAARESGVPFYVAAPSSSIDWELQGGGAAIPIEERSGDEVRFVEGRDASGQLVRVQVVADASPVRNPAFDVTPARLVSGLVTERGICAASREGLAALFPERIR